MTSLRVASLVCSMLLLVGCNSSSFDEPKPDGPPRSDTVVGGEAGARPSDAGASLPTDGQAPESSLPPDAGGCAPPLIDCDGRCVDLQSSAAHCGSCGSPCDPGAGICQQGNCEAPPKDCRDPGSGCSKGYYCDLDDGRCYPGCAFDDQCPQDEHCEVPPHSCACDTGYHRCAGVCSADNSTATCGSSCVPCSPPQNATATCDGAQCGYACDAGHADCSGACALCPGGPSVASTRCEGQLCVIAGCAPGYRRCAGGCCPWNIDTVVSDARWAGPELATTGSGELVMVYSAEETTSLDNLYSRSLAAGGGWSGAQKVLSTGSQSLRDFSLVEAPDGKPRLATWFKRYLSSDDHIIETAIYEAGAWKLLPETVGAKLRGAAVAGTTSGATCRAHLEEELFAGWQTIRKLYFDGCYGGNDGKTSWPTPWLVGEASDEWVAGLLAPSIYKPQPLRAQGGVTYATPKAGKWIDETVGQFKGYQSVHTPAYVMSPAGTPAVAFNGSNGVVLAIRSTSGGWSSQVVDSAGDHPTRLAFDSTGNAVVSYCKAGSIGVRWQNAGGIAGFDADKDELIPAPCMNHDIALDSSNALHVVVRDNSLEILHYY